MYFWLLTVSGFSSDMRYHRSRKKNRWVSASRGVCVRDSVSMRVNWSADRWVREMEAAVIFRHPFGVGHGSDEFDG